MSTRVKPLPHPPGALWLHRCLRCESTNPTAAGHAAPAACSSCGASPIPELRADGAPGFLVAEGIVLADIQRARAALKRKQQQADERERQEREARRARLARALLRHRRGA